MEVKTYVLKNSSGMEVRYLNYGGIITHILVPDKKGVLQNVVLPVKDPFQNPSYLNAIIGRVANRLARASYEIEGVEFHFHRNDGENSLHGGKKGLDKVFWKVDDNVLSYRSPDGDEGHPGNLDLKVKYSLTDKGEFIIEYSATTDRSTHVNLTQHCYFNLSGDPTATMLDHELQIISGRTTPAGPDWIPTGGIAEVDEVLDFRKPRAIGSRIQSLETGYNHNYVLEGERAALLHHPASGRSLEVRTTQPGLMLYTGHYLELPYSGVALEAQHFPDTPHHQNFPSTLLRPGEKYNHRTSYRFFVSEDSHS